jgi:hypothetical protein
MCSAEKANEPVRAADLYTSTRFRADRAYAESNFDRWYILSGKHGLLSNDAIVEPYDFDLSQQPLEYRQQWAQRVAAAISIELFDRDSTIELRANCHYQRELLPALKDFGFSQGLAARGKNRCFSDARSADRARVEMIE